MGDAGRLQIFWHSASRRRGQQQIWPSLERSAEPARPRSAAPAHRPACTTAVHICAYTFVHNPCTPSCTLQRAQLCTPAPERTRMAPTPRALRCHRLLQISARSSSLPRQLKRIHATHTHTLAKQSAISIVPTRHYGSEHALSATACFVAGRPKTPTFTLSSNCPLPISHRRHDPRPARLTVAPTTRSLARPKRQVNVAQDQGRGTTGPNTVDCQLWRCHSGQRRLKSHERCVESGTSARRLFAAANCEFCGLHAAQRAKLTSERASFFSYA